MLIITYFIKVLFFECRFKCFDFDGIHMKKEKQSVIRKMSHRWCC